ncbi:MAG: DUF2252 domain-containing protein [Candidatus Eremiobacteraeota bacterium]|nr:DUF2252 domain-containing protein [Candidatus Eremiobacteraeota bacterium]
MTTPTTTKPEGKALRTECPRSSHGEWTPKPDRDPIGMLRALFATLIPDLVPLRIARMSASPYAFYRGAAGIMAADLAGTPTTGVLAQLCGDAHLANFGGFASPERRLVFDVNDFDETARGPWEWDVKRLAASILLCARGAGVSAAAAETALRLALTTYRTRTREYAEMSPVDVWYATIDIAGAVRAALDPRAVRTWERTARDAQRNTALNLLPKITAVVDGRPRFVDDPPLLEHIPGVDDHSAYARRVLEQYRASLRFDARMLLDRFTLVDVARKVVGIGSVGTWCALALLADDRGAELLLQVKEARASALEPYLGPQPFTSHGQRVVAGERMVQTASDPLLGWADVDGRNLYVRQYRDMKARINPTAFDADELADYAAHCGWALARAHARTGEPRLTGAYLGHGTAFDDALVAFANAYANQTEKDHAAFVAAFPAPSP